MRNWYCCLLASAAVAGGACSLASAQLMDGPPGVLQAEVDQIVTGQLEHMLFGQLPQEHQAAILAASPSEFCERLPDDATSADVRFEHVKGYITREGFDGMRAEHRLALATLIRSRIDGIPVPALCFEPGSVSDEAAYAFSLVLFGDYARYQQTNRWSSTTLSGGGLTQGTPTILTYSFVPDGTFCPNITGWSGNSVLFAWLNSRYGSQATWKPLFDQVFARWASLTGLSYVYEPNDDGVNLNQNAGVAGVRGDVRIAAMPLDGNSGVLAYNNFPQDGDMVFDAYDSFYNSTSSNSLRLRNVAAHEHGHGLGMLHVCPANGTKLMEPFVSTAYDGPQTDDILNGNRHYGDYNEHNDTPATATALGDPGFGVSQTNVSIDDNADVDYYSFTVNEPKQIVAGVTPRGGEYQQGTQTSSCNTGTLTNYDVVHDLAIDLFDSDGVTLLATTDDFGVGVAETLNALVIDPGTYYLRVRGDSTNACQLYDLLVSTLPATPLVIEAIDAVPSIIAPGSSVSFDVRIVGVTQSVASANLRYRDDGGAYQTIALSSLGADAYRATLPEANCADQPEFYIEATGSGGYVAHLPAGGSGDPYGATVGVETIVLYDDAETNIGWTVSGTATDGQWNRGVPAGDGTRGDPPVDADGSGAAWLTDNLAGNSDVDNGTTILTSPALDASHPASVLSYWTWFSNDAGAAPNEDSMTIEVSDNNGGTWTIVEVIGPTGPQVSGGWYQTSIAVADYVTPSNQFRIRVTAADTGSGSVVEAGVDGVSIIAFSCEEEECVGDFNGDQTLDFFDIQAYLAAFNAHDPAADMNNDATFDFFDVQSFLAAFAAGCP
ncbi:MAG: hypothetical protein DYG94_11895 [Leptolyngbya sp. PLA3]|nr:hypothetical protein [Leptolyngbya sp. PL-A3]